jgi:hypothetical protein
MIYALNIPAFLVDTVILRSQHSSNLCSTRLLESDSSTVHTPPLPTKQISNSRGTIPAVIYSSTLEKVPDCVIEMEARRKVVEMKMVNKNVNSLKVTTWQTAKQLLHCSTNYDKDTAFVSKFSKGLYSTSYGFNIAGKELQ